MKKSKLNGNGHLKSLSDLEGKEIEFPVTYHLKAVMNGTKNDDDNKQQLVDVFTKYSIEYRYHDKKVSRKGSYVSFTYEITLVSYEQMKLLYDDLRKIKDLKFAV